MQIILEEIVGSRIWDSYFLPWYCSVTSSEYRPMGEKRGEDPEASRKMENICRQVPLSITVLCDLGMECWIFIEGTPYSKDLH